MHEIIAWQIFATLSVFMAATQLYEFMREINIPFGSDKRSSFFIIYHAIGANIFLFIAIHSLQKVFCGC